MTKLNKKYFWFKLKEDFFQSKEIKMIRKLPSGADILIVLLKLQLKSLSTNGIIEIDGLCDSIEDEISVIIDEDINLIKLSLAALRRFDLISLVDTKDIKMLLHNELVGSETASTIRSRKSRELSKKEEKALLSNTNATNCNTDIEIDIEKEKELYIENRNSILDKTLLNKFINEVINITGNSLNSVEKAIKKSEVVNIPNMTMIKCLENIVKPNDFLKKVHLNFFIKEMNVEDISNGKYLNEIKKENKVIPKQLTESQKQILKRNEIKDGIYDGRFD